MVWIRLLGCAGLTIGFAGGVSAQQVPDRDPLEQTQSAFRQQVERAKPEDRALAELRQRIAVANYRLNEKNRVLNKTQSELEHSDPIASKLRAELNELEKAARKVRESLARRLDALPEYEAVAKERALLIREVQELRVKEREILTGKTADGDEDGS